MRRRSLFPVVALSSWLGACDLSHAAAPRRTEARAEVSAQSQASGDKASTATGDKGRLVWFEGACDASGAVPLDEQRFIVADDEDNVLRVYDADRGGAPLMRIDVSPKLALRKQKDPESDIEGATRVGDVAFFITSHGRTRKGKRDPDRFLFFATELPRSGPEVHVHGQPYRRLLEDMLADPKLAPFELERAAELAPKEPGGMNIEGLTAAPDGSLWIGFRSPVREGRALVVRLENPKEVLAGKPARFSSVHRLDLGGLGIRALSSHRGSYLIAAGPTGEGGPFRLYRWDGAGQPKAIERMDLGDLTPEGFFTPEERDSVLVLSDDGKVEIDGRACKKLKDPSRKRFRGVWLKLPDHAGPGR
ncbi:MAG: DUF3616 domain-containing protein [Pseudomonadota bacterium]|nr:MAG: DUF3616 domain-containing protein [Pseudomonadota bacterium]